MFQFCLINYQGRAANYQHRRELSSPLSDRTLEILNNTTSTSADITRVKNDVSGLGARIHDMHSSLPQPQA